MDARRDLIGKLRAFRAAACELAAAWCNLKRSLGEIEGDRIEEVLNSGYPLGRCFVELTGDIGAWTDEAIDRLASFAKKGEGIIEQIEAVKNEELKNVALGYASAAGDVTEVVASDYGEELTLVREGGRTIRFSYSDFGDLYLDDEGDRRRVVRRV